MYLYEGGGAYAFHLCRCISPPRRTIALLKRIPLWNMLLHSGAPHQGRRTSVCLRRAIMTAWPLPHPPGARATQETQQWLPSPEHRAWKRNIHEKRTNRSFKNCTSGVVCTDKSSSSEACIFQTVTKMRNPWTQRLQTWKLYSQPPTPHVHIPTYIHSSMCTCKQDIATVQGYLFLYRIYLQQLLFISVIYVLFWLLGDKQNKTLKHSITSTRCSEIERVIKTNFQHLS